MPRTTFPDGEDADMLTERYVNPFTDFGFKRLFGEEPHKELLIDFLNELLKDEQAPIRELTYLQTERLGPVIESRGAVFDLYCESETGEKFIVEMQKAKQKFFKDRSVFYSTFPIQEQSQKGGWDFRLRPVYTIAILDFVFDDDENDPDTYYYKVKLADVETFKVFYEKLTFIYLEMPKFRKTESELESHFDKWLYVLRNLQDLTDRPPRLQERIFARLFEAAELARFDRKQMMRYEHSLKVYRDMNNVIDYAKEVAAEKAAKEAEVKGMARGMAKGIEQGMQQGMAQGIEKGRTEAAAELARKLLSEGMGPEQITRLTGLNPADWQSAQG